MQNWELNPGLHAFYYFALPTLHPEVILLEKEHRYGEIAEKCSHTGRTRKEVAEQAVRNKEGCTHAPTNSSRQHRQEQSSEVAATVAHCHHQFKCPGTHRAERLSE